MFNASKRGRGCSYKGSGCLLVWVPKLMNHLSIHLWSLYLTVPVNVQKVEQRFRVLCSCHVRSEAMIFSRILYFPLFMKGKQSCLLSLFFLYTACNSFLHMRLSLFCVFNRVEPQIFGSRTAVTVFPCLMKERFVASLVANVLPRCPTLCDRA